MKTCCIFPRQLRIGTVPIALIVGHVSPVYGQELPLQAAQHRDENGEQARRSQKAVTVTLTYTSDTNADVDGGGRRGTAYLQRLGAIADADFEQLVAWRGATFHGSMQAIQGTGLSTSRVDNLLTVSGIEAAPALRMFNLWVEQKLGGAASVRVGQFTAGQEFAIAPTANFFVNSSFGWPGSFALDLPGGGPSYPIAVPAVRLAASGAAGRTTFRTALFAANPTGRDRRGLAGWRFRGKPLAIAEFVRSAGGKDPAWTVVAGGWWNFAPAADLRLPAGTSHSANRAVYLIGDVRIRPKLRGFVRLTLAPEDRNPVARYLDAGITAKGLLKARPDDILGLAVATAWIAPALRPNASGAELAFEASYQLAVHGTLSLQPNVQWIVHPVSPDALAGPAPRQGNALVIGLRTALRL
ncbi:carbohydrate porin [Sphingomonas pituitosa]|uniref:carbohydrate porin n=1 Tax=Sphingomonas pituitosa TaxID=99597 RepID=UPI000A057B0C|nr:carbohydrate porin [Sphingomonas pituitosa]